MGPSDAVLLSDCSGASRVAGSDGDGIETRVAIGQEMAVAHDEASPDAANSKIAALRQAGQVIQGEVKHEMRSLVNFRLGGSICNSNHAGFSMNRLSEISSILHPKKEYSTSGAILKLGLQLSRNAESTGDLESLRAASL